jgi:Tol biopolymer transport system component
VKFQLLFLFAITVSLLNAQENSNLVSHLETYSLDSGERTVVLTEKAHFEAPNWSRDGSYLLINQEGKLYRVYLEEGRKELLDTGKADRCNNDHGISHNGKLLAISNNDPPQRPGSGGSRIYVLPVSGGEPELVTPNAPSYWHGWSADDQWLVYVGERNGEYDIYKIPVDGGEEIKLTDFPGLQDGPEYSPDGKYIYYNSAHTGVMELWRMTPDGKGHTQLTDDPYSNWFAHPSPDGKYVVYLSYLQDQGENHPPMKEVALKLMDLKDNTIRTLATFTGGQGTINVPSWSPDSKQFAFVSYSREE